MTTNIVSVAVLKDIVVVVVLQQLLLLQQVLWVWILERLLGDSILRIFFSAILGVVLGYLIRLYMKYVNAELLLFVITLIYSPLFVIIFIWKVHCCSLQLVSLLQMARTKVVNSSLKLRNYQHLSLLCSFTIAGAKLHLDVLVEMALLLSPL